MNFDLFYCTFPIFFHCKYSFMFSLTHSILMGNVCKTSFLDLEEMRSVLDGFAI